MIELGPELLIKPEAIEVVYFMDKVAHIYAANGHDFVVEYKNCTEEEIRKKLCK